MEFVIGPCSGTCSISHDSATVALSCEIEQVRPSKRAGLRSRLHSHVR